MDFYSSETYKNIHKAYESELISSTKYNIYGRRAREDGYQQIGNVFDEISGQERQHGEIWLRLLNNGEFPSTLDNLEDAARSEAYGWEEEYASYAEMAEQEGFYQIANLFRSIAKIERHHDYKFERFAENIRNSTVFCKKTSTIWSCLECGNTYIGDCAPLICPVCGKPQGYYELSCENY